MFKLLWLCIWPLCRCHGYLQTSKGTEFMLFYPWCEEILQNISLSGLHWWHDFHKLLYSACTNYLYEKMSIKLSCARVVSVPKHRMEAFKRSFSYQILNATNRMSKKLKALPLTSLKRQYNTFLINLFCTVQGKIKNLYYYLYF